MNELTQERLSVLQSLANTNDVNSDAIASAVGGFSIGGGLLRLFSHDFPPSLGTRGWNKTSTWKYCWSPLIERITFFGEDVFGNQIGMLGDKQPALLWNHETGEMNQLWAGPIEFLETVFHNGIGWIDSYSDQMSSVGRTLSASLPLNEHIHWVTPLFLGGQPVIANTAFVPRVPHLIGHGELYAQVGGFAPGTEIIPNSE